jgi:hypothetical protein
LRRVREQPQRAIETRLAGAVLAADQIQRTERRDDIAQRSIVRDGKGRDHGAMLDDAGRGL